MFFDFKNKDEEKMFNLSTFGIYGTNEEIRESMPAAIVVVLVVAILFATAYCIFS